MLAAAYKLRDGNGVGQALREINALPPAPGRRRQSGASSSCKLFDALSCVHDLVAMAGLPVGTPGRDPSRT